MQNWTIRKWRIFNLGIHTDGTKLTCNKILTDKEIKKEIDGVADFTPNATLIEYDVNSN